MNQGRSSQSSSNGKSQSKGRSGRGNSQGNTQKKSRNQRSPKSAQSGKRRRSSRNRRPTNGAQSRQSAFEKFQKSYFNLLEKHLEARKKYYDLYHRADPKQLAKLERNFYRSIEDLRAHEENVKPEFAEEFKDMVDGLNPDTTYSQNHNLPVEAPIEITEDQIQDPHFLPSQSNHEFKGDEEESVGTLSDYKKYKGLPEEA